MLYNVRIKFCVRSLCHKKKKKKIRTRPFEGERQKLCGIVSLPNDKCTHAYAHKHTRAPTFCHSPWQTRSRSHPRSNFPRVSAVSSLQCDSPPPNPLLATLRIIEYRSLAFAAVCKRVLLWTSVCLTGALQGHRYGNLSMGSFRCAVTEHRVTGVTWKGGQEGVGERCGAWYTGGRGEEPQGLEVPYSTVYSDWSRIMRTCTDLSVAEGHRVHYNSCYACTNKSQL